MTLTVSSNLQMYQCTSQIYKVIIQGNNTTGHLDNIYCIFISLWYKSTISWCFMVAPGTH